MSAKAYAVMGAWGAGSDHREWTVAVHLDKSVADVHLTRVRTALNVWLSLSNDEREHLAGDDPYGHYLHELDNARGFCADLDDQHYWIDDVPILVDAPTIPLTLQVGGAK